MRAFFGKRHVSLTFKVVAAVVSAVSAIVTIFEFVIVPTVLAVVTFVLGIIYGIIAFITEWAISNSTLTFTAIRNFAGPWLLPSSCCRDRSQYETLE